jgi:general secretion pathway protein K
MLIRTGGKNYCKTQISKTKCIEICKSNNPAISGGYNTPPLGAELGSRACPGVHTRDLEKDKTDQRVTPIKMLRRKTGIALIIVLWVTALLIVISLSFSVMARTEVFSTITFKEQVINKYLAEAGMQRAIMEIFYRNANKNNQITFAGEDVYSIDGKFYYGGMDTGYYKISINDESGKININTLTDSSGIILNNLLVNSGVDHETADTIVDSILDWKDADNLTRLHGAEDDYYMSLPNPYKAKNANFDNPEELLLVKGVTAKILYGDGEKPGLINFITLYSNTDKININAAALEVLKAIPFMSDDSIQQIMNYRNADNTKKDGTNIQTALAGDYAKIAQYISTSDSGIYAIEVLGYKEKDDDKKGFPLKSVIMLDGNDHYRMLYYQSPANIKKS